MAITNDQYKNLQRYLNDEMTIEQEAAFEKELDTDTELKEYYRFEIDIRSYLDLGELKKNIPGFSAKDLTREAVIIAPSSIVENRNVNKKTSGRSKRWMPYAAAVAVIIIGSVLWVYFNNTPLTTIAKENANKTDTLMQKERDETSDIAINSKVNPDVSEEGKARKDSADLTISELAKQYFSKDTGSPDDIPDTSLLASNDIAKNKDPSHLPIQGANNGYTGRIPDKNSVDGDETNNRYREGIDFIEAKKYMQAAKDLQWVIDNPVDEHYTGKARWYLALTYLMENNKEAAIPLLTQVSTDTAALPFNEKAVSLLNDLRKK